MKKKYSSPEFIIIVSDDVICTSGNDVELDYTFGDTDEEMFDQEIINHGFMCVRTMFMSEG